MAVLSDVAEVGFEEVVVGLLSDAAEVALVALSFTAGMAFLLTSVRESLGDVAMAFRSYGSFASVRSMTLSLSSESSEVARLRFRRCFMSVFL